MNVQATQRDEAAVEAINSARDAHVAALNAGDADAWVAGFTDDGVQMPPNFPANVGSDAIRAWAQAFLGPWNVAFGISPDEVQIVSSDWAFESGAWEITLTSKAGGEPVQDAGKYITVYRRQPDDSWATARDIWNSNSPPAGMS